MSLEIELTQDKGVLKEILVQGTPDTKPTKGQQVEVLYTGKLLDGTVFDSTSNRNDDPFKFGLGTGQVIKAWDIGVASMNLGEKCILTCAPDYAYGKAGSPPTIPGDSTLKFEVELLDYYNDEDKLDSIPKEERIAKGQKCKDKGNKFFGEKKFSQALSQYTRGSKYTYLLDDNLYKTCKLNSAMVYIKTSDFDKCINSCSEVIALDSNNTKALYRRATAYSNTGNIQLAKEDLQNALRVDPQNKDVISEINRINKIIQQQKQKEKKQWGNMFGQSYYEDKQDAVVQQDIGEQNPQNPVVFLDIQIGEQEQQKIEIELFKDKVPKTAENFLQLCTGQKEGLTYKNSIFHRLIANFMIQGGDFTNHNGTGGKSIYGEKFEDENFAYTHTCRGVLSMANSGKDTNGSQFFINFKDTPHLNGKHVVFGIVRKNIEYLDILEKQEISSGDKPKQDIKIVDCGVVSQ